MIKCTKGQVRQLKTALRWKMPAGQRQRIQMVLLRESGMTQPLIAAAMGVSLSTVNRAHMAYDTGGLEALKPKPIGGRKRENMTLEDEKALLARFAKAAGAGEMLNIHDLKAAYEKAIGHETSKSTIYNLLARHGWRKLMPRPFHPRRDSRLRTLLKKWLSKCCEESQADCRQARPVACGILLADEASFGRINRPRPCWAPIANTSICTARSLVFIAFCCCSDPGGLGDTFFQSALDYLTRRLYASDRSLLVN